MLQIIKMTTNEQLNIHNILKLRLGLGLGHRLGKN